MLSARERELEHFRKVVYLLASNVVFVPNAAFGVLSVHFKNLTDRLALALTTEFVDATPQEQHLRITISECEHFMSPLRTHAADFLASFALTAKNQLGFDVRK